MAKKVVSQSNTEWVKKGTTVNGKTVAKGYLAQKGKPAKKVSARVQMVQQTGGVATGDIQNYKGGRRKTPMLGAKPAPAPKAPARSGSSSGSSSRPSNPNANVKVGTIRVGAAGNKYNKWNGSKWVPVSAARTGAGSGQAASRPSRPVGRGMGATTTSSQSQIPPRKPAKAAAPAGRGASAAAAGGSVTKAGAKYAKTGKQTGSASKGEVLATLIAAGTLPLGAAGLVGRGAAGAAGAAAKAIAGRGAPKAIGSGARVPAKVTVTRMGPGVRGGAARPTARPVSPPKAITRRGEVAPLTGDGRIKTSPVGNPKMGPARPTGAQKASLTKYANKKKAAAKK